MQEAELRALIEDVRTEKLPRRSFIERLVGLGLSAPMASMLLMHAGVAQSQPAPVYKPTKRGGGGALKVLWWQGATLLQPHFAGGTKDQEGSRIFYEPLAVWDNDGNLVPILAAEIPTVANGGVLEGGKVVRWRLKKGVTWHDGKPFTADDVVFTWDFARDPASACVTIAVYKDVTVTKVDDYTVLVSFKKPTPFWATAFVAAEGMIIPKHLFGPYAGAKSRDAPTNLKPVGTGPYKFVDFKPGDIVLGEINKNYHMPNRPFFDTIEMKGGGDATSAARAVLQTGEYDYAWNLQVEDEVLKRMEAGGKGKVAHRPRRRHRVHPGQHHRPVERGRRRARQRQEQALRLQRPEGARGDGAALRQEEHAGVHLRPHRLRDRQLHEQPAALPLDEHQVGVQRRQGERAARCAPAGRRVPTASARRAARR